MMKFKVSDIIKDIIIYSVVMAILVITGYYCLKDVSKTDFLFELSSYIGTIVIILFGIIGIFDFANTNGLNFLVPHSYEVYIEEKYKKRVSKAIEYFVSSEVGYMDQYSNNRISFFLDQLGLTQNDFELLKTKIVSIKMLPLKNINDAKKKLEEIIYTGKIISKQSGPTTKLVYKKVDYFIDFTNIAYVDDYCNELTDILMMLIQENIAGELSNINKIIVPHSSNRLLGISVSKKLGKSIINVTKEPRIFNDEFWEGNFDEGMNKGIVIHDVLVTGDQILESLDRINSRCNVKYIFCLINRTDYEGKKKLEDAGYTVFSLIDLNDDDLEKA